MLYQFLSLPRINYPNKSGTAKYGDFGEIDFFFFPFKTAYD